MEGGEGGIVGSSISTALLQDLGSIRGESSAGHVSAAEVEEESV